MLKEHEELYVLYINIYTSIYTYIYKYKYTGGQCNLYIFVSCSCSLYVYYVDEIIIIRY